MDLVWTKTGNGNLMARAGGYRAIVSTTPTETGRHWWMVADGETGGMLADSTAADLARAQNAASSALHDMHQRGVRQPNLPI